MGVRDNDERAKALFLSLMTKEQRRCFEGTPFLWFRLFKLGKRGLIPIVGSDGGCYIMQCNDTWRSYNVRPTPNPMRIGYCAFGAQSMPIWDHYLTVKLWIEADETSFLLAANRSNRLYGF